MFHTATGKENFTGTSVWSLKGFIKALQTVNIKAIEYHNRRGDFESWADLSLRDEILKEKLSPIKNLKLKGEPLRKRLIIITTKHFNESINQAQASTKLF